jgi:hypothetical protein
MTPAIRYDQATLILPASLTDSDQPQAHDVESSDQANKQQVSHRRDPMFSSCHKVYSKVRQLEDKKAAEAVKEGSRGACLGPFRCAGLVFPYHGTGRGPAGAPTDLWSGSWRAAYSDQPDKKSCGVSSPGMVAKMIEGRLLEEAVEVSNKAAAEALGGLSAQKRHCSHLAADAVRAAIEDYWNKQKGTKKDE